MFLQQQQHTHHTRTCRGQDSRWLLSLVPVAAHRIMRKSNLFVLAAEAPVPASQLSQLISNCPATTAAAAEITATTLLAL